MGEKREVNDRAAAGRTIATAINSNRQSAKKKVEVSASENPARVTCRTRSSAKGFRNKISRITRGNTG